MTSEARKKKVEVHPAQIARIHAYIQFLHQAELVRYQGIGFYLLGISDHQLQSVVFQKHAGTLAYHIMVVLVLWNLSSKMPSFQYCHLTDHSYFLHKGETAGAQRHNTGSVLKSDPRSQSESQVYPLEIILNVFTGKNVRELGHNWYYFIAPQHTSTQTPTSQELAPTTC